MGGKRLEAFLGWDVGTKDYEVERDREEGVSQKSGKTVLRRRRNEVLREGGEEKENEEEGERRKR